MLSCVSPSIQPADLRASDACAQLVTDTQVQTVLELSGRNFGTNTSYLSVLLSNGTLYVETRCTVFLDFALRRGGIAESLIHRAPLLTCPLPTRSSACSPCYLQHTAVRCVTSLSRSFTYSLVTSVSGQSSNVLPYSYNDIASNAPPDVLVVVPQAVSADMLNTVGGDTIVLYGALSEPLARWFSACVYFVSYMVVLSGL